MGEHIKSRQRLAFSDDRAFVHYQLPNPHIFDSYNKHSQQFNYDFNQFNPLTIKDDSRALENSFRSWNHQDHLTRMSTQQPQPADEPAETKCYYNVGGFDLRQRNDQVENLNIIRMLLLSHNNNYFDMMMKNMSYHYSNLAQQQSKSYVETVNSPESLNPSSSSSKDEVFSGQNRYHKKARTSFHRRQVSELEKIFAKKKYLSTVERNGVADSLEMTDSQVKTWFRNRRTKWRRQNTLKKEMTLENLEDDEMSDLPTKTSQNQSK